MSDMIKNLKDFLDSEEGKQQIEKFFEEEKAKKDELNRKLIKMHLHFVDGKMDNIDNFSKHIEEVVKENLAKIKFCEENYGGYELIEEGEHKGERCEITPTESMDLLFEYFRKHGKDVADEIEKMFLSEKYDLDGYSMELYQGQGCFLRLLKGEELLIQI